MSPRLKKASDRTFSSLRIRNYRLYFVGQLVSVSGTWIQWIAQSSLIVYTLHKPPVVLGIATALQFLPMFLGGMFHRDAATVQPARLARGLRRALLARGVRIHEGTPVTRFGAGTPVVAETPAGSVRAGSGVVAMNAWATAWKRFRRVLMARGSRPADWST